MKKKLVIFTVAVFAAASISACNKQKAPRLDYTEKMKTGLFSPNGLPGENHVGATDEEKKFQGYSKQANSTGINDVQKPEAKDTKPAPAEEKKPEVKDTKPAPAEEKKPEAKDTKSSSEQRGTVK